MGAEGVTMLEKLGFDLLGFGASVATKTWQLQRVYHWQLFLPSIIGGVPGILVSQYCQAIQFKDYSSEVDKIRYGAEQRGYAGERSIDSATLVFIAPTDQTVFNYFDAWSRLKVDHRGFYGPKSKYKKSVYLVLHDSAGVETNRFTLKGCFPMNKQGFEGAYEVEDVQRLRYTLNVDSVTPGSLFSRIGSFIRLGAGISNLF